MKVRLFAGAGLCVALLFGAASTASAGEVSGPPGSGGATGDPTPVNNFWIGGGAASICSFSGLNDEFSAEEPTQTQSYGTFQVLVMKQAGVDAQTAKTILGEAPSDSCNPTRAPWGNPRKN